MRRTTILKSTKGSRLGGFLFGLPFFLAGVFIIAAPWIPSVKWEGGQPPPLYFVIPFGSVFALVGFSFMFFRQGFVIDRESRTVTTWWGLLFPLWSTRESIPPDTAVTMTKVLRKSDKSSYWVYPVLLQGNMGPIKLEENVGWFDSRNRAEEIAKFLNAPVIDATEEKSKVTPASDLDKSFAEKLKESGEKLQLPHPPKSHRTQIEMSPTRVRLRIPPPGFSPIHLIKIIFLLVYLVFVTWFFFMDFLDGLHWEEDWFIYAFASLFYIVPIIGFLFSILPDCSCSQLVEVDPVALSVARRCFFFSRPRRFPLKTIEDLDLVSQTGRTSLPRFLFPRKEIRVVSDQRVIRLGRGLSAEEIEWIHKVLQFVVAKGT